MTAPKTALGLLLLLSACGGGGGGPADGGTAPGTVAGYCDQLWADFAARWAVCDRGSAAFYAAYYAPALRCGDAVQAVAAGRATYDRTRAGACLGFVATASCDAIEAHVDGRSPQADCLAAVAGRLGVGATCYSPESCASNVCLGSPDSCPSTCLAPHAQGAACDDGLPCGPGLHCEQLDVPTIQTCQPLEAQGTRCMFDTDCQPGLRCDYGVTPVSCQPRRTSGSCFDDEYCTIDHACRNVSCVLPKAAGESCAQGQNDCGAGLWCSGGVCVDGPTATQSCALVSGEERPCTGAYCSSGNVCVAWTEGASCSLYTQCAPTATCAGSACTTLCAEP